MSERTPTQPNSTNPIAEAEPKRRDLLRAIGLGLAAAPLLGLAACGPETSAGSTSGTSGTSGSSGSSGSTGSTSSSAGSTGTSGGTGSTSGSSGGTSGSSGTCATTPEETAGPYPDKTGMLNNAAYFRQDITEGKQGLPLSLTLTVVDVSAGCAPVSGAIVEVWHCDASGDYSEYSQPGYDGTGQTFLRGLQTTDSSGQVKFTTIYPGWYLPRATHIHIEVYVNGSVVKTTQLAFPDDVSAAVYATSVYAAHGQNSTKNSADQVFSDGTTYQLATLAGDTTNGYAAALVVGI